MIELTDRNGEPLSEKEIERQIKEEKRARKILVFRNWLNIIFIILSIIAIVGVLYFDKTDKRIAYAYGTAVVAILVKMVDALFRMPGFGSKIK